MSEKQVPQQPSSLMGTFQSEVAQEASPMLQFLLDHARTLAAAVVVFILFIIGYWFYAQREHNASEQELVAFSRITAQGDTAARLAALEKYLPTAPDSLRTAALLATAEAASKLKNWNAAYTAWRSIAERDPDLKVTGTFGMVQALAAEGKNKEALDLLNGLAQNPNPKDLVNINSQIVVLAEETGDLPLALKACQTILDFPGASDTRFWTQKLADLRLKASAK